MDIEPDEQPHESSSKPEESKCKFHGNITWEEEFENTGLFPCRDEQLFEHVNFYEQTLVERLCVPGKLIFVVKDNNTLSLAKIESCVMTEICIKYLEEGNPEAEWINSTSVVIRRNEWEDAINSQPEELRDVRLYAQQYFLEEYPDRHNDSIVDFIEVGKYFEMQDEDVPTLVHTAIVLESNGGIVLCRLCDRDHTIKCIYLADFLCHAIGWGLSMGEQIIYYNSSALQTYSPYYIDSLPEFLFERISVKPHLFNRNMLVEVQGRGAEGELAFYPGRVVRVHNRHFFEIQADLSCDLAADRFLAHIDTPGFYPVGFCKSQNLKLHWAKQSINHVEEPSVDNDESHFTEYRKPSTMDFWDSYAFVNNITNPSFSSPQHFAHASSRVFERPIDPMQYVEVFTYKSGYVVPCLIIGSTPYSVSVIPIGKWTREYIVTLKKGSTNLFPCGYAAKHKIPVSYTVYDNLRSKIECMDIIKNGRAVPSPIFRRVAYSGRGRPEKRWSFIPAVHLKEEAWLPKVFINRTCYGGDFQELAKVAADHYPAGIMFGVIKQIIKDLYRCAAIPARQRMFASLNTLQDVPVIIVKHRWRSEHVAIRVPVCERSDQFPGWISNVLHVLGCCSNFISTSDAPCTPDCQKIISLMEQEKMVLSVAGTKPYLDSFINKSFSRSKKRGALNVNTEAVPGLDDQDDNSTPPLDMARTMDE